MRRRSSLYGIGCVLFVVGALSAEPAALRHPQQDSRLRRPRDYNSYSPWTPPARLEQWQRRRQELRAQLLVALGLWPMPEKTPLNPVIHGRVDRPGYSVEKVFFASYPGFYVTGNLYRPRTPDGRLPAGKLPGVLCPHGHWPQGRFYEASESIVAQQLQQGAEKTKEGAKYPLQARCAQLARMGCVVFHYDMVGYADSTQLPHREGFKDVAAELWLQSFMGLQTWNSIRALDFLLSLPEVDPQRLGVTGASGGGTQTFILGAVDDRPAVAFPAVMVSTGMQGGCVCENCSYLRLDTGNIEIAALFAPRPLALSGANDWTIKIETDGLPQLRQLYRLYGAADKVAARCWPQFGHNFNQVSREFMYTWFNRHLHLGQPEPVTEQPFVPLPPKELSVFDAQHPRPKNAVDAAGLRRYLTAVAQKQLAALFPHDAAHLSTFRQVVGTALRVMMADRLPDPDQVVRDPAGKQPLTEGELAGQRTTLSRKGRDEVIPLVELGPIGQAATAVVWVHPEGFPGVQQDAAQRAALKELSQQAVVLIPDVFRTGLGRSVRAEPPDPRFTKGYIGYIYCYNRTLLANRVHDLLTVLAYARGLPGVKQVHLVGVGRAGPWVVLARGLCGDAVARTVADLDGFCFEKVQSAEDEMFQPGALRYGGLLAFAALCAPQALYVHNTRGCGEPRWLRAAYEAAGQPAQLVWQEEPRPLREWLSWLRRGALP